MVHAKKYEVAGGFREDQEVYRRSHKNMQDYANWEATEILEDK